MRTRFRRLVGIVGTVAIVASTATGVAAAIGQQAASASVFGGHIATDFGFPATIGDNFGSYPGQGYTFTLQGWTAGETITLTAGPSSGQLALGDAWTAGAGSQIQTAVGDGNCNTFMAPVFPNNTSFGYFGVNQNPQDYGNYFGFSDEDNVSALVSQTGGAPPPAITVTPVNDLRCLSDTSDTTASDTNGGETFQDLVLTFTNTSATPTTGATIDLGFNSNLITSPVVPLNFDISFGAATGPTQMAAVDTPAGCASHTCVTNLTIDSNVTIIGETPGDAHALNVVRNTDPAIGPNATGTGGLQVPDASPVSNFTITDSGDFLPPPDQTENVTNLDPVAGLGNSHVDATDLGPLATATGPTGAVCLVIDNGTHNNLIWTSGSWSVAPGENQAGFVASTGGVPVSGVGSQILQLPVGEPANGPAVWTASNLSVGTAPGFHTHADGPVYAAAYWLQGPITPNGTQGNNCGNSDFNDDAQALTDSPVNPSLTTSLDTTTAFELGYVQITTVTELADSIYGANADATSAQAVDHQFDYAKGECIGNHPFPSVFEGPSLFVGRDDYFADTLGAAYPAGAFNTGVVVEPVNSVSPYALATARHQGAQVIYLLGGNLAQSDAVAATWASTPSYVCGGVTPRFNILGQPIDLTVIRIGGTTVNDTNHLLATLPGAEVTTPLPGAVGAFAAPPLFNDTGDNTVSQPTASQIFSPENSCLLVTNAGFQDAASASTVAYGWPMPLITTDPTGLSPQALQSIYDADCQQIFVVGGNLVVSDSTITTLGGLGFAVYRIAGIDGSDTSTQFAAFTMAAGIAPLGGGLVTVGLGASNVDFNWDHFTARTAGQIIFSTDEHITAHVVLLARGDYFVDATVAAAVLGIHNGLFGGENLNPLVLTENPGTLGSYVTAFLNKAGLAVSGLLGSTAGFGPNSWQGQNSPTSNVYVIQPIGGPIALFPSTLSAALNAIG